MKFVFTRSAIKSVCVSVCIFLFIILTINVIGYIFDVKYLSIFTARAEINKYEVRSRLLMEAMSDVGICIPEKTVEVWVNGLKMRNAAMQYSVMTQKLKDEYARQLEETAPNWVTGLSSPWVESYKIIKAERLDESNYRFHVIISTMTSTGPAGDYNAILSVTREGYFWRISMISLEEGLYVYTGFIPEDRRD